MGSTFEKGDLVVFDNGKEKMKGLIIRLDRSLKTPIRVQFENGSTRSYTLDGRSCRHSPVTLSLEPIIKTSKFKKGDLVEKRSGNMIHKGIVIDDCFVHTRCPDYCILVEFETGVKQSFTKEGKQYTNENIVLFLEEIKTPAPEVVTEFQNGDPVIWTRGNFGDLEGTVVSDSNFLSDYPILVKFDDGTSRCFTKSGQLFENGCVNLLKKHISKPALETVFKKGDAVVYQDSSGTFLHGEVCYIDEDGRTYPIEIQLNGYNKRKISFTADGRLIGSKPVTLFLTKDFKFSKMKEASKKVKEVKTSLDESMLMTGEKNVILIDPNSPNKPVFIQNDFGKCVSSNDSDRKEYDHVSAPHYRKSPVEAIDIFEKVYGAEMTALWCEITALKYRLRLGHKPTSPIEDDLKKEKWYLEKREELLKKVPMAN